MFQRKGSLLFKPALVSHNVRPVSPILPKDASHKASAHKSKGSVLELKTETRKRRSRPREK